MIIIITMATSTPTSKQLFLTKKQSSMCILSPKYYNLFFLMVINLSATIGQQHGKTFLLHSLPTLVYYQHQKLTYYHQPNINTDDVVAHSILIPTNLPLQSSFLMAINISTTIGFQAGSIFLPHSLAILVYLHHQKLTYYHQSKINTDC